MAISKNISLNILAQVRDYQREMSKIPGITEKQAAIAARRLEKRLSSAQANAAKSAQKAAAASSQAWAAAGKVIGSAVSLRAVKGLAEMTQAVADLVNRFNDLEGQTGISANTLQAVDIAARQSGGSIDQMKEGLRGLSKRMQDASMGTGEAYAAFQRLGIEVTNSDGSLRDADSVFRESIASLQNLGSETEATAEASRIFGESAGPLLAQQLRGVNLEESAAFVARWGVDAKAAEQSANDWQVGIANLGTVVDGIKAKVVGFLGVGDLLKNTTLVLVHYFGILEAAVHVAGVELDTMAKVSSALMDGDPVGAIDAYAAGIEAFGAAVAETARRTTVAGSAAIEYQADLARTHVEVEDLTAEERRRAAVLDGLAESNQVAADKAIKAYEVEQKRKADALRKWQADKAKADAEDAKRAAELLKRQQSAEAELMTLATETANEQLTASQQVEQERLSQLQRLEAAEFELGTQRDLRAQINADAERKQTEIVHDELAKRMDAREAEAAQEEAVRQRRLDGEAVVRDAMIRNIAIVADAFAEASRKRLQGLKKQRKTLRQNIRDERDREQGARDWVVKMNQDKLASIKAKARNEQILRQAAGVVSVLSNAAIGYMGLVANPAVIAASGGFGAPATAAAIIGPPTAIQLAAVKSQNTTFHTGTDEVKATLLAGEAVLNRGAAERMGRENIAAANRGEQVATRTQRIDVVFRDRVIDTMVARVAEADGALSRLLPAPRMQINPYGAT